MADSVNRQILLASRPDGAPVLDNFRIHEAAIPEAGEGEALMRSLYLSLDPYMRGRMSDRASYADPVAIGGLMGGGAVGQVIASSSPLITEGDYVLGHGGWQEYFTAKPAHLRKLDPAAAPLSTALGVLGPDDGYALAVERGWAALFLVRDDTGAIIERATPAFEALLAPSPAG